MPSPTWFYSPQAAAAACGTHDPLDADALAALNATLTAFALPKDPAPTLPQGKLKALIARHNATLKAAPNKTPGKNAQANAPLFRLINQDAKLSGAAQEANQKIQAILQQYQAKKSAARVEVIGPQFFLESAPELDEPSAAAALNLCHQLNGIELKIDPNKLDSLQELNSIEGLYQLPLWALRLNLSAISECLNLQSLELMVLPHDKAVASNYRGPLWVVLKLNFTSNCILKLIALDYEESSQVSCAALISELMAQSEAEIWSKLQGCSLDEALAQCYEQVTVQSMEPELAHKSLLLAPYFKQGTTDLARLNALKTCACALGYVLTHLLAIKAQNKLQALSPETKLAPFASFASVTL